MKQFLSSIVALMAVAAVARSAEAQLGARSLEVQPFVGIVSFDDDLFGDDASLESTAGFGARLGYNFTDTWGLEGSFNYTPNAEADLDPLDDTVDDALLGETTIILAHGNLNYNFALNNSRLVPFLTAGGGIANFNVDNDDNIDEDGNTDGEINGGGGLKLFLSETIAARADVRNHWIFASRPNEDVGDTGDEQDAETTSNLELSAGVGITF